MAFFPKIDSPCPYRSDLAAVMDGDFCRMCSRRVVDLTAMDDTERLAFLAGCKEQVCVSYRLPLRPAIAAAALAVTALPTAAAAEDSDTVMIVVGGIKDPAHARMISTDEASALKDIPVVYEEPIGHKSDSAKDRPSPPAAARVNPRAA
jgi:predicted Fe-S protein YdhL (DUF1289 family)